MNLYCAGLCRNLYTVMHLQAGTGLMTGVDSFGRCEDTCTSFGDIQEFATKPLLRDSRQMYTYSDH